MWKDMLNFLAMILMGCFIGSVIAVVVLWLVHLVL
jgi:hypothetical protein